MPQFGMPGMMPEPGGFRAYRSGSQQGTGGRTSLPGPNQNFGLPGLPNIISTRPIGTADASAMGRALMDVGRAYAAGGRAIASGLSSLGSGLSKAAGGTGSSGVSGGAWICLGACNLMAKNNELNKIRVIFTFLNVY